MYNEQLEPEKSKHRKICMLTDGKKKRKETQARKKSVTVLERKMKTEGMNKESYRGKKKLTF